MLDSKKHGRSFQANYFLLENVILLRNYKNVELFASLYIFKILKSFKSKHQWRQKVKMLGGQNVCLFKWGGNHKGGQS